MKCVRDKKVKEYRERLGAAMNRFEVGYLAFVCEHVRGGCQVNKKNNFLEVAVAMRKFQRRCTAIGSVMGTRNMIILTVESGFNCSWRITGD